METKRELKEVLCSGNVILSGKYLQDHISNYFVGRADGYGVGGIEFDLTCSPEKADSLKMDPEAVLADTVARIIEAAYGIKYTAFAWNFDDLNKNHAFKPEAV